MPTFESDKFQSLKADSLLYYTCHNNLTLPQKTVVMEYIAPFDKQASSSKTQSYLAQHTKSDFYHNK